MKKLLSSVVLLLLGVALAQEPIRLGVNLELSGRFATIGTTSLQGIETALEQMPMVMDTPIELSVCDNATSVEGSVACANRFVDEGVLAVLGPIASSHAIPAAEVLQDAGIIMISTASTNPATTQIGEYIFRMAFNDQFQGRVVADYLYNDLGARRVAIFRQQDDDYSFGLAGFFQENFEALGAEETIVIDFVAGATDFSAQINDLRGFNPDAIFLPNFCAELATLVSQLKQQGFTQTLMGADASDDSQCPEGGGEAFDGFQFTGFITPDLLTDDAATRASEFEQFFRIANPDATDFNGFTLSGADSYNVVLAAINEAGSADPAAVLEALSNLEGYPGVSGDVTYAGTDGTPADRTIGLFEYQVPADNEQGWEKMVLRSITLADLTGEGEGQ